VYNLRRIRLYLGGRKEPRAGKISFILFSFLRTAPESPGAGSIHGLSWFVARSRNPTGHRRSYQAWLSSSLRKDIRFQIALQHECRESATATMTEMRSTRPPNCCCVAKEEQFRGETQLALCGTEPRQGSYLVTALPPPVSASSNSFRKMVSCVTLFKHCGSGQACSSTHPSTGYLVTVPAGRSCL
jgi:hypothetical protein